MAVDMIEQELLSFLFCFVAEIIFIITIYCYSCRSFHFFVLWCHAQVRSLVDILSLFIFYQFRRLNSSVYRHQISLYVNYCGCKKRKGGET